MRQRRLEQLAVGSGGATAAVAMPRSIVAADARKVIRAAIVGRRVYYGLCMPPVVINLRKTDDSRDVVHRAVQTLAEGKLVVFPTETVYGLAASARRRDAVAGSSRPKGEARTRR